MGNKNYPFKYILGFQDASAASNLIDVFEDKNPLDVEIGFGTGETLLDLSVRNSERNYLGIEQNWERIEKTIKKLARFEKDHKQKINNVKLVKMDAGIVFKYFFKSKSIDNIICLFPCPWPKTIHAKNRLFRTDFFRLLNSRLKDGGSIKIVTDHKSYYEWILEQTDNCGFEVKTEVIKPKYKTKFEKKWIEAGQNEFYEIKFSKLKHIKFINQREIILKAYKVKHFDPNVFELEDLKGDISVIFKNYLFDVKQQKAMVHLIVSEENLTQHLWVAIFKKNDAWTIFKADGQNILSTKGIATAIEMVYKAALKAQL